MPQVIIEGTKDLSDPTFKVRWCLEPEEVEELKDKKVEQAYLVLSVFHEKVKREVQRYVVKIDQLATYVRLRRAGLHKISAFIAWSYDDPGSIDSYWESAEHKVKKHLRTLDYAGFPVGNLYDGAGKIRLEDLDGWEIYTCSKVFPLRVDVSEEFFAPEPPEWVKKWTNLLFKRSPVDQCAFRRRFIFAFSLQPVALTVMMVWWWATRLPVYLVTVLTARRYRNFRAVIRPWRYSFRSTWDPPRYDFKDLENSWVITDENGQRRPLRFFLLHPLLWVLIGLLVVTSDSWAPWVLSTLVWVGLWIVLPCVILSTAIFLELRRRSTSNYEEKQSVKKERKKAEEVKWRENRLDRLVCSRAQEVAPSPITRVKLTASALKARVCRPYSVR